MTSVPSLVFASGAAMIVGAASATFLRIRPSVRLIAALAILLSGFLLLGKEIWQTVSWVAILPFVAGFALQRYLTICPCGQKDCSHVRLGMMVVLVCLMFVHSLFDGHILAEFTSPIAISAMLLHKFLDGLALAVVLGGYRGSYRWIAVAFAATATPLGLVYLPRELLSPSADALLVSVILGIYASTACLIAGMLKTSTATE